jgi:thiamine pyrophosphate-dependent acetolactate synthase large subunit-like protein
MSDPKGPVYLCAAREILEMEIKPQAIDQSFWSPVGPGALPYAAVKTVSEALVNAEYPLIITGYSGRNQAVPGELVKLTTAVPHLRVLDAQGCDMCYPANEPSSLSVRYGVDPSIEKADAILVLDCDVPWINTRCKPRKEAKIYHVDVDPLKQQIPVYYIDALGRWRADSYEAVTQILRYILENNLKNVSADSSRALIVKEHKERLEGLAKAAPKENGQYGTDYLCNQLKKLCPPDTIWCIEAVTNTLVVADQIQATTPGSWLNAQGGGLGWSGGGT